jgi:hypothetical protein
MNSPSNDDMAELALMNAMIKSLHSIPFTVIKAHIKLNEPQKQKTSSKRKFSQITSSSTI